MRAYRTVFSLICATLFLQLGSGVLGIVTPLGLRSMGLSTTGVGIIAALHAAGFMAGAISAPRFIRNVGNIRCFSAAAAICGIGSLTLYIAPDAFSWGVIRFVQGAGFALMFTAVEAWLGAAIPAAQRGGVLGVYHVGAKAALFIGPLLIFGYSALDPANFIIAGICLAAALVPVCVTRQTEPLRPVLETQSLASMIKLAPSATVGVFMAGIINTGTLALLPVFAEAFATPDKATQIAVVTFAVANVGGLLSQWPLGRLSDHIDRRSVVGGMALVAAGAAFAIGAVGTDASQTLLLVLLGVWGAGSLSFYGICVAHGIDRASEEQMTPLMSGLLFVWATGAVIGPVLSGVSMRTNAGAAGLFWLAGAMLVLLSIFMLMRRVSHAGPAEAAQEDWASTFPKSVVGSELDPRTPGT